MFISTPGPLGAGPPPPKHAQIQRPKWQYQQVEKLGIQLVFEFDDESFVQPNLWDQEAHVVKEA